MKSVLPIRFIGSFLSSQIVIVSAYLFGPAWFQLAKQRQQGYGLKDVQHVIRSGARGCIRDIDDDDGKVGILLLHLSNQFLRTDLR